MADLSSTSRFNICSASKHYYSPRSPIAYAKYVSLNNIYESNIFDKYFDDDWFIVLVILHKGGVGGARFPQLGTFFTLDM